MKKIIIIIIGVLCFNTNSLAQSQDQNYISSRSYLDSAGTRSICNVKYFNGIGEEIETVVDGVNNGKVYTGYTYDEKGRITRSYKAVPANGSNNYNYNNNIPSISSSFYGDTYAYEDFHYDTSDRIIAEDLPGSMWRSNNRKNFYIYGTNTDKDKVLHYGAPVNEISLVKPEYTDFRFYPAGSLLKETNYDADSLRTTIFKDLFGNVVLERRDIGDTYFVYNDLGQLRYVLPPRYQEAGYKDLYAYEYRYDGKNNLVKKILPGCKYVQYWYDKERRLTFSQDNGLRESGKYRFFLYDKFGRLVIQGTCKNCNRKVNEINFDMTFQSDGNGFMGTGYSGNAANYIEETEADIEAIYYYDSYRFLKGTLRKSFEGMEGGNANLSNDRLTGCVSKASNGKFSYIVYYYDKRGNVNKSFVRDALNNIIKSDLSYTFTNNIEKSFSNIELADGLKLSFIQEYEYDKCIDKKIQNTISIDYGRESAFANVKYGYDKLGRLSFIERPGNVGKILYDYDMHGWISKINTNSFKEQLYYAEGPGEPCFNGNISAMVWKNGNFQDNRGYLFTYDKLNRLTKATYGECDFTNHSNRFDEYLRYDSNGNIIRLQRRGKKTSGIYGKIDNLHIYHNGNQLDSVKDDAARLYYTGAFDFNGAPGNIATYKYNGNGSLIEDTGRGIALIEYDEWNNPKRIQFSNGNVTEYIYSADGTKLRAKHYTAVPNILVAMGHTHELTTDEILEADSTDYIGDLVLSNGKPSMYLFNGGYCSLSGALAFHYYNHDHLGNVREVVSEDGSLEQVNNYYPFGAPFSDDSVSAKNPGLQPYKYTGKELDLTHGLNTYDHGARQNYSILGVWDRIDPMAEEYYNISPYSICGNNPCVNIDPTGKIKISAFKPGYDSNNGENNDVLIQTVLEYNDENKDVIHFFCHGYQDGLDMQLIKEPGYHIFKKVEDARNYTYADCKLNSQDNYLGDVIIAILNNSVEGFNLTTKSDFILVLHACDTGNTEGEDGQETNCFASELSKQLPNAKIIAPSKSIGVKEVDGAKEEEIKSKGVWKLFENGQYKSYLDEEDLEDL